MSEHSSEAALYRRFVRNSTTEFELYKARPPACDTFKFEATGTTSVRLNRSKTRDTEDRMPIATPSRSLRRLPIRLVALSLSLSLTLLSFSFAVSPGFGPHRRRSARPNALPHAAPASRPAFNRASSLSLGVLFPTVSLATPRVSRRLHRSHPSRRLAVRRRLFNENDGSVAGRAFSPGVTFPSTEINACAQECVSLLATESSRTGRIVHGRQLASSRLASRVGVPLENFSNAAPRRRSTTIAPLYTLLPTVHWPRCEHRRHVLGNMDRRWFNHEDRLYSWYAAPLLAVCENHRRRSVVFALAIGGGEGEDRLTDDDGLLCRCCGR